MEEHQKLNSGVVVIPQLNNNFIVGGNVNNSFTLEPFNKLTCEFFDCLSKKILNDNLKSEYPDIIALGFWLRKNNILVLKKRFEENIFKYPLGLVFHITPNNVPINFAYSLFFGLITGNTNIVKVPSKNYFQVNYICRIIKNILVRKKFSKIKKMINIIKYDNDDNITKKISKISDARLIWGGDSTVEKIKSIASQTRCIDISFPDRYSLTVINLNKIIKLNFKELENVISKFYTDNYTFDQNACNSSHLIFWLGDKKLFYFNEKFWKKLNLYVENKLSYPNSVASEKYNKLCLDILNLNEIDNIKQYSKNLYVTNLNKINKNIQNHRGQWGYFYQFQSNSLSDLAKIITKKYQTLVYYGFDKNYFNRLFFDYKIPGIDRIVPIGRSMEMNYLWDGYDLFNSLTRVVDIK